MVDRKVEPLAERCASLPRQDLGGTLQNVSRLVCPASTTFATTIGSRTQLDEILPCVSRDTQVYACDV